MKESGSRRFDGVSENTSRVPDPVKEGRLPLGGRRNLWHGEKCPAVAPMPEGQGGDCGGITE